MKNFILSMFLLVMIAGCQSPNSGSVVVNPPSNVTVTPNATANSLGANLDLQALGELVKKSPNAQTLESDLNVAGSINNLDLDNDGKVDYITVTEYGDANTKGFSFTVDLGGDKGKQEVATVELSKTDNNQASMNISGNQTVYGDNYNYSSNYAMTDLLIWSYLWAPHSYYYSPYHYGYYPGYYHPYGCMPYRSYYSSRVRPYLSSYRTTRTTTTTSRKSSVSSPNRSANSAAVTSRAKSLSVPSSSQKTFSTTSSSNSRPSTSGFGNSRSSGSSSSTRSPNSGSRSSGSSSRSFGSSSRSSGSSSRSSGSSSRGGRR